MHHKANVTPNFQLPVHLMRVGSLIGLVAISTMFFSSQALAQRVRNSIPAPQVPAWQLQQPSALQSSSDISYLRQSKPDAYLLDSGDVLGIFLEGVLGEVGSAPPVHFPPEGSSLGPSMGFPIVVRQSGAVSLPLVDPIPVRGLTIRQAEALIKSVYLGNHSSGKKILNENSQIIVTLQRKRTVNVIVIRQDNSSSMRPRGSSQAGRGPVFDRSDRSARSESIQLPAGENDVLNALLETGGLPGLNAASDVRVYSSSGARSSQSRSGSGTGSTSSSGYYRANEATFPRTSYSPNGIRNDRGGASRSIPLNLSSGSSYSRSFDRSRSSLSDGDVLVVGAKPTEVYYTSGLLRGGEHPLPRDRNLTVLEAVALAGGPIRTGNNGFGFSSVGPTELNVIRNNGRNGRVNIRVDLGQALTNPAQQILVAPGDHLILRHKPIERVGNFGIGAASSVGLRRIFQ